VEVDELFEVGVNIIAFYLVCPRGSGCAGLVVDSSAVPADRVVLHMEGSAAGKGLEICARQLNI